MSTFDDPLANLPDPKPLSKSKGKTTKYRQEFKDPLAKMGKADAAKATQSSSSMRGQYWQRTLRLPPEYQDLTLQIHHEGRARSIADTERWIYAMGLQAYFIDGKRPSYVKSVARDIELPDFSQGEF